VIAGSRLEKSPGGRIQDPLERAIASEDGAVGREPERLSPEPLVIGRSVFRLQNRVVAETKPPPRPEGEREPKGIIWFADVLSARGAAEDMPDPCRARARQTDDENAIQLYSSNQAGCGRGDTGSASGSCDENARRTIRAAPCPGLPDNATTARPRYAGLRSCSAICR